MASDVDICNTALSYLGDSASVANINPPDGSAQASYCSRFFPLALSQLQEMHTWGFCTTRVALAAITNPVGTWKYAYAGPSDVVNYLEILAPDAENDYSEGLYYTDSLSWAIPTGVAAYTAQPFVVEKDSAGNDMVLTDQENAVLRYTQLISDVSKLSPLATEALARLLASKLAGPLLKGETGRAEAEAQYQAFMLAMEKAVESDSNQRRLQIAHSPTWMARR